MEYENENDRFEEPQYGRGRSASPQDNAHPARNRSASPNERPAPRAEAPDPRLKNLIDEEGATNPGTNLFVTGIHPRLTESDIVRLFEKYGDVHNCSIMLDPHTKESRGFGFVNMVTGDQAEAAKEGLQGEVIEGRTLSIEKARRSRPRTPTPGKYFGPPKRELRGGMSRGGGRFDRYDDRRSGYGGGRRYDEGRPPRYDSYSDRRREYRDDYGYRGVDRYASTGRDDRYGDRRGDGGRGDGGRSERGDRGDRGEGRRGGYYDRDDARAQYSSSYPDAPSSHRESYAP